MMEAFLGEAAIQRASAALAQCHLRPKLASVYAREKKKKKTNIKLRPAEHVENRSKLIGNGIDLNRTIAKAAHPLNSWYPVIKHGNGHPPSMIFPFPIAMDHQLKW